MKCGLEGISRLWKCFCKSGRNLSVDWSDHVNGDGSILFSTVQTELIESQLVARILKSVHTVVDTGMFSLMEGNDINLTLLAYRAGHLRSEHISQFHLPVYLTPELIS